MASTNTARTTVTPEVSSNRVLIRTETSLYPRDAVLGAAYVFIDRCFVFLDSADETTITVALRGRDPLDETSLLALAGEFGNELLAQALRQRIAEKNRPLLETIVARVIGGAAGARAADPEFDLAELESLDLEDEPFDDPLGIAMSWEDKYGDKRASKAEAAAAKEAAKGASGGSEG